MHFQRLALDYCLCCYQRARAKRAPGWSALRSASVCLCVCVVFRWFFQCQEGWAQLQLWFTNGLPPSLPRDVTNHTAEPCSGFVANSASHCCVLPSCASEDQGPHTIILLECLGKPLTLPALRVELPPSTKTIIATCSRNFFPFFLLVLCSS